MHVSHSVMNGIIVVNLYSEESGGCKRLCLRHGTEAALNCYCCFNIRCFEGEISKYGRLESLALSVPSYSVND